MRGTAFTVDLDQARLVQLFEVMRDGRGADVLMRFKSRAEHTWISGNLLEDRKAARIGDRSRYRIELLLVQLGFSDCRHRY